MAYDRSDVRAADVIIIAGFMLAILSSTVAAAATKEEVAHCRAIEQRAERLDCFKSLKAGPKAKMEDAAPARTEDAASAKPQDPALPNAQDSELARMKHAAPSKTQDVGPTMTKRVAPAKTEDLPSAKTGDAVSPKTEEAASAKAKDTVPTKTKRTARMKTEDAASAKTGNAVLAKGVEAAPASAPATMKSATNSKTGDPLLSSTSDDPASTSAIDRFNFVPGQPLCVDRNGVAAMLVAGLLTSNPKEAATNGCQTLPEDATLKLLERYPSVFSSMRIVRVTVTSPTHPELTFGFTIEMGRQKN